MINNFGVGFKAEDLFVRFMEENGLCNFVAGDVFGKTINPDIIEELFGCKYIAPNRTAGEEWHGAQLDFGENLIFTMPDKLMITLSNNHYHWFDIKNRKKDTLRENKRKIQEYAAVGKYSKIKSYIAVVIWNNKGGGYDILIRKAADILRDNYFNKSRDVEFYLERFEKLNKKPIVPIE